MAFADSDVGTGEFSLGILQVQGHTYVRSHESPGLASGNDDPNLLREGFFVEISGLL